MNDPKFATFPSPGQISLWGKPKATAVGRAAGSARKWKTLALAMLCPVSLTAVATQAEAQTVAGYNFGTTTPVATHTSGTLTNVGEGAGFSDGNSFGTVSAPINTTSVSSGYTGASGAENLGNAVAIGAFNSATSAYYALTLTPTAGNSLSLSEFDFGARSTSTGPTSYALYSSLDNYATPIFVDTVANNSTYVLKTNAFTLNDTAGAAVTLRLYTYGGAGSASSGSENSRIDDVAFTYATAANGATIPNQYFDLNGTTAGSGIVNGSTNTFSGLHFNTAADGTGTTAAFTNDGTATATFSAGTDSAAKTYTVNIDTAVMTKGLTFTDANVTLANAAGGSLTLTGATVDVASGATATISQAIGGTTGLTKTDTGTLVLSGTNTYTGGTTVSAGILTVGADANLGNVSGGIILSGGTLQLNTGFSTGRGVTGTGSLDIAPGTTLTSTGAFATGGVTLVDTGTLSITGTGTGQTIGNVTFNATSTVANTGSALAVGNVTTTTTSTGVATISGPISLASGTHTLTVVDGNTSGVDLALTGNITGTGALSKSAGAGTLALSGDNSGYSGTITLGGSTTTGGTISIGSATALGTGVMNFNTGTLSNDTGGPLTTAAGLSIGASVTGAGAKLAGSAITFQGAVSLYKGTGTTVAESLVVNNSTTFTGAFGVSSGSGTGNGLTVSGTGTLTLTGLGSFTEPLTVSGATVSAANTTGKALGGNTALNVSNNGTLLLAAPNQVVTTAPIGLKAAGLSFAAGANQGSGATVSGGSVSGTSTVGLGTLTLSANASLTFLGSATTAVFAGFDPTNGGAGTFSLNVTGGGAFGTATASADGANNRLIFNQDIQAAGYLGDITFNSVADAVEIPLDNGFYEITGAVPEPSTICGGLLVAGLLGWNRRRQLRGLIGAPA